MRLRFNEAKATQAAARFLMRRGGRMSYIKLVKLLYLLDREALLRWGRPVTTDRYVSMDKGPVVSRILDLITDEPEPGVAGPWRQQVSAPENYEVHLIASPSTSELSRAEEELIDEIYARYGHKSRWELVQYSHTLPEWLDPDGSAVPITYRDILKAGGKTELEISAIEAELESLALADRFLEFA